MRAASPTASKDTDEVDRFCERTNFKRIGHMPDVDAIRRSRLKKKTLFEMPDDEGHRAVPRGIHPPGRHDVEGPDPLMPHPLEDRDIFELLGFD